MSDRQFVTQNGHKVRYAVGQPMGIKSSFDMMALTHHVVIQAAALRAGIDGYKEYAVLGDDSTMVGSAVVEHYRAIMEELGVGISANKSVSANREDFTGAEFAKRLFLNGTEVTGIPMHLLVNAVESGEYLLPLWDKMMDRGILPGDTM